MESFIEYLAWVAIGLVVVALPFVLVAAYIFLDEGVRHLVRRFRKPAGQAIPRLSSQPIESDSATHSATEKASRVPRGPYPQLANPHRTTGPALWRTLKRKIHDAKSGIDLHLHIGHRKPAKAKS